MKLGFLPYLNVKPLIYTLEHGGMPRGWECVYAPPSRLARMLVSGEIAAAPVSSFATFIHPELQICPDICIAADGPVHSVLLLSRKPIRDIRTVALDTSSLSGASMLRIILDEIYNLHPEFINIPPDPVDVMLNKCDAAMVIGNPAMLYPKDGLYVLDLAQEWGKLTSLPAVFAVWAGLEMIPELISVLQDTKSQSMKMIPEIVRDESEKLGLSEAVCEEYLTRIIRYDLGEREAQGLKTFEKKCKEHGLLVDSETVLI